MTDTGIFATSPRAGNERLLYGKSCLQQGMGYQAAAIAAEVCADDLREFAPGYEPKTRAGPQVFERTELGRCAAIIPVASPVERRQIAALALRMIYEDGGTEAVHAVLTGILSALPTRSDGTPREKLLKIVDRVALAHGLTRSQIMSSARSRAYSRPRQEAYWAVQQEAGLDLRALGRLFGRDRATIRYGLAAHEARMAAQ